MSDHVAARRAVTPTGLNLCINQALDRGETRRLTSQDRGHWPHPSLTRRAGHQVQVQGQALRGGVLVRSG